jgi:hypothetical protein
LIPSQADGQRKELQRITADNKRLHRSLQVRVFLLSCHVINKRSAYFALEQEMKPTVPSLKQIEHRAKDLDR